MDRFLRKHNLSDRDKVLDALMRDFVSGSTGLGATVPNTPTEHELELLARHHGLPSPYLDWTQSPYVAAFFAFADPESSRSEKVSVWFLDREVFALTQISELELIDDQEAIRLNPRAIEQLALFVRVNSTDKTLQTLLGSRLHRFDMPSSIRPLAIADLDEMTINSRRLFRDLDGVARMAALRVSLGEKDV